MEEFEKAKRKELKGSGVTEDTLGGFREVELSNLKQKIEILEEAVKEMTLFKEEYEDVQIFKQDIYFEGDVFDKDGEKVIN